MMRVLRTARVIIGPILSKISLIIMYSLNTVLLEMSSLSRHT